VTVAWVVHRALRDVRRHRAVAAVLGVGFCLAALLGGAYRLGARAAGEVASAVRGGTAVIAYLHDDVDAARAAVLRETLAGLPGVGSARLVTSEEALARLRQHLGPEQALLDGVEDGFLPASVEIALTPAPAIAARARGLAARLRRIAGIVDVDGMEDRAARLSAWLRLAGWLGNVGLALAALCGVTAVALATGLGRERRRAEGAVFAALGDTRFSSGLPASLAGGASAALGAALGIAVLYAIYRALAAPAYDALTPLGAGGLSFLPAGETAAAVALALALGAAAGMMAARTQDPADAAR